MVNVITIQIQETIQKQRVLEAIENEIAFNARQANRIIEKNTRKIESDIDPNFFDTRSLYTAKIWGTSEALKYIVQLSADVQANLSSYYDVLLLGHNGILIKYEDISNKYLTDCYSGTLSPVKQNECLEWNKLILTGEIETAKKVEEESLKLLEKFHPAQDRLHSYLLRILMGDTAIGMLSDKKQ